MSEPNALDVSPPHESHGHELTCHEIVDLINWINSADGPYNQPEAAQVSATEMQVAYGHQLKITDRIECLVRVVAQRSATSEAEIFAKTRALNALKAVDFWDQESLHQLEASIERDWEHLRCTGHKISLIHSVRPGWLTRQLGGHARTTR